MKARKEVSQLKATARKKSIDNQEEAKAIDVYSSKSESETTEGYFPKERKEKQDEGKHIKLDEPINQVIKEADIKLEDPDVKVAPTKIQTGFKGVKARNEMSSNKNEAKVTNVEKFEKDNNKEQNAEELYLNNLKNDHEVEIAATRIQAGFKGMQVRKNEEINNKNRNDNEEEIDLDLLDPKHEISEKDSPKWKERNDNAEEIDINLLDPEVEIAATKIQAGFKGMKARKQVSAMKGDYKNEIAAIDLPKVEERNNKNRNNNEEEIDIDLLDPEVEMAATKIQAGFKGMKARKGVSAMKGERHDVDEKDVPKVKERNKNRYDNEEQKQEFKNNEVEESNTKFNEGKVDIDLLDPEVEIAATKIQAGFKGMKARKEVSALKGKPRYDINVLKYEERNQNRNYNEEEINIDLLDPEVEVAATKIQAGFKGMKARKDLSAMREGPKHELDENDIPEDEGSNRNINGNEEEINIDLLDPEVEIAATKIQAGFKGMKTRKNLFAMRGGPKHELEQNVIPGDEESNRNRNGNGIEQEINIDLLDPEVEIAATKIQAGYKGMKARREVSARKGEHKHKLEEKAMPRVEEHNKRDSKHEIAEKSTQMLEKGNRNENEEEIDNNLLDPEVEIAATKIQAGFKGMKARKEVSAMKGDSNYEIAKKDLPKVENLNKNSNDNEEEIDIDLFDPDVEIAATKIQAGFKGMKARKEVSILKGEPLHEIDKKDAAKFEERNKNRNDNKEPKQELEGNDKPKVVESNTNLNDEEIDIDLLDPEVEIAATKIQAGFKGMKARKEVSALKGELVSEFVENDASKFEEMNKNRNNIQEEIDIDLLDPEVEIAATKIQAGFKGMKARKEVSAMKGSNDFLEKHDVNISDPAKTTKQESEKK